MREQPREVSVKLDAGELAMSARARRATDPLDRLPVSLQDKKLRLAVKGRDLRVVVLGGE